MAELPVCWKSNMFVESHSHVVQLFLFFIHKGNSDEGLGYCFIVT